MLFVEEPEAHTHPQMQYVFIRNIKILLWGDGKEDKGERGNLENLQAVITTHSAHITSQSDFNDIKCFLRKPDDTVVAKNLSDLEKLYDSEKESFQFLKQYLTLNKAELFFSDKIIFIEGDTERILLPAMMKKIDNKYSKDTDYIPLLSQNISIAEVGAYSHVFDKFLTFLEIKTLIITDLDSVRPNANGTSCNVAEGTHTSNASIKHFLGDNDLNNLTELEDKSKILSKNKDTDKWQEGIDGQLCIVYQTKENNYHARSFEDAFISINLDFIKSNKEKFRSLKNRNNLDETQHDFLDIAKDCIDKKPLFATDVLFYSDENFSNWKIPKYINQGLLWLAKT